MVRFLYSIGCRRLRFWSHDQEAAYRFLPAGDIPHMYFIQWAHDGPEVWLHFALNFGAKGAVWGYDRFSDKHANYGARLCRSLV